MDLDHGVLARPYSAPLALGQASDVAHHRGTLHGVGTDVPTDAFSEVIQDVGAAIGARLPAT
jgi:hypothetical protein